MKQKDYILLIDSGNGGEYTLKILSRKFSNENFILFKDKKNSPYGNKDKKQLLNITKNNLDKLFNNYRIKIVIFACNTLSVVVLNQIKKIYKNVIFLGVFPPIKDSLKNKKNTLVLSTHSTLRLGKINKGYKSNNQIKFLGFKDLAKKIDENINNLNKLIPFLIKNLKNFSKIENVVLGCTHFNLIKKQLRIVLNNKNLNFFEGSTNTAKVLRKVLVSKSMLNLQNEKGTILRLNS